MGGYLVSDSRKVTTHRFIEMKQKGEKISMLTSYDFTTAGIVDRAGVDGILIGDSASNVMAGNHTTLPITVDQMIYHARSVVKAVNRALVVCDMPFGSYQVNVAEGVKNAIRIMKESGCDALKLEGSDAKLMAEIGCFAVTLEKVPAPLAAQVTQEISVPTIGIGAGNGTDGQVLVIADMLGMTQGFSPRFLRRYADLNMVMTDAIGNYVTDVKNGDFPNDSESYY